MREVVAEHDGEVLGVEVMPDHVHLLVEVPPAVPLSRLVQLLKGRSSRRLRAGVPQAAAVAGVVVAVVVRLHRGWRAAGRGEALCRESEAGGVSDGAPLPPVSRTGQTAVLERHCADARFVWNLALEQLNLRLPGRRPGSAERFRQLADARQGTWLGEGSSSVQQQALRDFDRAVANWRAGSHRRPRWRRRGLDDGFCVRDVHVQVLSRRWAQITVPKCGPVRFRLSRPLPDEYGMARVTRDRAGRWHVSLTAPQPVVQRERTGRAVGVDLGVAATVATSNGELLHCPWLTDGRAAATAAPRAPTRAAAQALGPAGAHATPRSPGYTPAPRTVARTSPSRPAPVSSASTT